MNIRKLLSRLFFVTILLFSGMMSQSQILSEGFESATFPPTGWLNAHTTGSNIDAIWNSAAAGADGGDDVNTDPFFLDPHSGSGMAEFKSYDYSSGNGAILATSAIDLSGITPKVVSFWMHRDDGYDNHLDSLSVYVNTNQNLSGAQFLGKINRYIGFAPIETGGTGWYKYSFPIPSNFNSVTNYIVFHAMSDWGNHMFIDDVSVDLNTSCSGTPVSGTASASSTEICSGANVDLSLVGAPTDAGITFQWESSPAGANTFSPIAGATSAAYTIAISASTDVRCLVTCTNGSASTYSNIVTITAGTPTNDEACAAISLVSDGPASCGNTTCATAGSESDDPTVSCSTPNNTVWYKFTPASNGIFNIKLKRPDGGSNFLDTWVDIFTASGTCPTLSFTQFSETCSEADLTTFDSAIIITPALTAGTDYYIRLDGYAGAYGTYCISVITPPTPPSCTTNIIPANGATGLGLPVLLSWNAVSNANYYSVYLSTTNPPADPADYIGDVVGDTAATITGLDAATTYYWYIVPKNDGGGSTGCASNVTSFTTGNPPSNDGCDNATDLTVSNGFCTSPVIGDLSLSDSSAMAAPACQTNVLPNDVWYKVTVPASGTVTIQTSAVNENVTDLVLEAYSGSCGSLTAIDCNDDGNPDPAPSAFHPKISLAGRTPGEVIYLRVMPYSSSFLSDPYINQGAFAICAFDTTLIPVVATASSPNTCTNGSNVNVDSAFKYTWVTFTDPSNGKIIAQIYPDGNKLGNTTASFYVNGDAVRSYGGIYYLDRNITITPTVQPSSVLTTRLYFTDAELSALSAAAGGAIRADLNTTKTSQTCASSATVASGGDYLPQTGNNAYFSDHYIQLENNSFSTFYLHKGIIALPVGLISFNAQRSGRVNKVTWSTSQEINTRRFIIERSIDGRNYVAIGTVGAAGNSNSTLTYSFTDFTPGRGINYYRLKVIDLDNREKLSAVKSVRNEGTADVAVYPNPARDVMQLSITSDKADKAIVIISDMNGRAMYTKTINITEGANYINVNTANFSSATYVIKIQLNEDLVVRKFNKL